MYVGRPSQRVKGSASTSPRNRRVNKARRVRPSYRGTKGKRERLYRKQTLNIATQTLFSFNFLAHFISHSIPRPPPLCKPALSTPPRFAILHSLYTLPHSNNQSKKCIELARDPSAYILPRPGSSELDSLDTIDDTVVDGCADSPICNALTTVSIISNSVS